MVLTVLCVIFMGILFIERKQIQLFFDLDKINGILLLYFLYLFVSVFFAYDINMAIQGKILRQEGLSTILLYFLVFLMARFLGNLDHRMVKFILITACIVALFGIFQYYGIDPFPRDYDRVGWRRAFSTMGNPNFLGSYLVLMLPFTFYYYVVKNRKMALLGFGILFWCLLASNTRSAWVGAIATLFLFFVLLIRKGLLDRECKKRSLYFGLLLILLVLLFDFHSGHSLSNRFLSITRDATELMIGGENADRGGANRIYIWKRSLDLVKMKPIFGHGIENLHIAFGKYFTEDMVATLGRSMMVDKAHNEYLHIAVSSGVPSLLLYLAFLLLVLRRGYQRILKQDLILPLFVAVMGYLVQAFFNISVVSVAYIHWAFLGFLAGCETIE